MRASDIVIGKHYRLKRSPDRYWARPVQVIPAGRGRGILVECVFTESINEGFGYVKHFKPSDFSCQRASGEPTGREVAP